MRNGFLIACALALLCSRSYAQPNVEREKAERTGELLDWSGTSASGELILRDAHDNVYQYSFDGLTRMLEGGQGTSINATRRHQQIIVNSEACEGTGIRRAVTVEFLEPAPVRVASNVRSRQRAAALRADELFPRGNLEISGVVVQVAPDALMLRLRSNERMRIALRPDTRYFGGGQVEEPGSLGVNERVCIRAGKNWEDRLEAYQIVWGAILEPSGARRSPH